MVTRLDDDRGQLLLIGAVSIALVVLGTVVLLNGMLFDDTISSRANGEALDDAQRTVDVVETDLERLATRVQSDVDLRTFDDAFAENVTAYSRHYTNLSFDNDIVYVSATYNSTASVTGTLLRQRNDSSGTARTLRNGNDNEDALDAARNATSFSRFNLTVYEFACPSSRNTTVRVEANDSAAYWEFRLTRDNCGSGATRYVEVYNRTDGYIGGVNSDDGGISETGPVEFELARDGDLEIDNDRAFEFASGVAPQYDLVIESTNPGSAATGTYSILTDSAYPPETSREYHPNITSVVARPAVDIVYQRPELQFDRTIVLDGVRDQT